MALGPLQGCRQAVDQGCGPLNMGLEDQFAASPMWLFAHLSSRGLLARGFRSFMGPIKTEEIVALRTHNLWDPAHSSFGYRPSSGITGSCSSSRFNFLKNCHTLSYCLGHFMILSTGYKGFSDSTSSLIRFSFLIFYKPPQWVPGGISLWCWRAFL